MKQQTLQTQYNLIKEGKGNKEIFIKEAKRQFPNIISLSAGFNETANSLKFHNIIFESKNKVENSSKIDFFKIFNQKINEAKAEEKNPTKEVVDMETRGYDYKDEKNIDNLYGQAFLDGFYVEMCEEKNKDKSVDEVKAIVAKNLAKDRLYYIKDGQFGIKGIGYTTEHPGLGEPKEPKGKYKSSGYGDLKENKSINENYMISKSGSKKNPSYVIEKTDGSKQIDMFFDSEEEAKKYATKKGLKITKKGYNVNEIGMFNDPIGYKKSEPNPKDQIFTKKFVGTDENIRGDMGYIYDIFKNGVKIATVKGEGNANAFINDEKRKLNESNDFEGPGLIIKGRTQIDNNNIQEVIDDSGFYGIWNVREEYFFFPEENDLDLLEQELTQLLDSLDINYTIEGQFNESINENNMIKLLDLLEGEYYDLKKEEKKKPTKQEIKKKKTIVSDKVKEIENAGNIAALEAKMNAIEGEIENRETKMRMATENEDLSEFINPTKIREMEKEVKELQKSKERYVKEYKKLTGKEYGGKKEIVGEMEDDLENTTSNDDTYDKSFDSMN